MIRELDRVRAFRADEPSPSQATIAAARAVLVELIQDELPNKSSELAGRAGPSSGRQRPSGPVRGRGPRRRRVRVAIALALVCVGIVVAGVLGSPTATSPSPATAAALEQLARVAASQAWTGMPGPGQYLYTTSETLQTQSIYSCSVTYVEHRESWIGTHGGGALRESYSHGRFTSASDRSRCRRDHLTIGDVEGTPITIHFPPGRAGLTFLTTNWRALSTNPARLLAQMRRIDGGPPTPAEDFVHIGDFLRESDAPPAIRAALYRAAKLIPGVRLLGPTRDHAGRVGLGVAFLANGNVKDELIFNQHTAALLDENYATPSGKLTNWTAYLEAKIVDTIPPFAPSLLTCADFQRVRSVQLCPRRNGP